MNNLTITRINELLKENNANNAEDINKEEILNGLNVYIEKKAVLGFDIYRYSQFPSLEQTLIPHLFKELYKITIQNCLKHESIFFIGKDNKYFKDQFIDSGDGGFQIFENPLQAIVFAIYFQANIKRYSSGQGTHVELFNIIGEITLRYSLTFDNVYNYQKNFYGPSIINNARIMAKDKLNRFLIDENTVNWFNTALHGIENLQIVKLKNDFKNIDFFDGIDFDSDEIDSVIFNNDSAKILNVDLLRIGEIKSKLDILSVHSLYIQTMMTSGGLNSFRKYTISLGNLNSAGITE